MKYYLIAALLICGLVSHAGAQLGGRYQQMQQSQPPTQPPATPVDCANDAKREQLRQECSTSGPQQDKACRYFQYLNQVCKP